MGTGRAGPIPGKLSQRELEVARLVADGLTNREIAARLFISERTVDGHLEHVREKLGVNTRAQVAAWVAREGTASPPAPPTDGRPVATPSARRARSSRPLWIGLTAGALAAVEAVTILVGVTPQGPSIRLVAGSTPVEGGLGHFAGVAVQPSAAVMSLPSDVAIAGDGTLYIADYRDGLILRLARGSVAIWAGGGTGPLETGAFAYLVDIGYASNVAVDPAGNLYFLTNSEERLQLWMVQSDQRLELVVDLGPSPAQFGDPWPPPVGGVAIAPDGTIFISDRSRNAVYAYTTGQDSPRVVAGTPGTSGSSGDNGAATGADLSRPGGLAVDHLGNLYIADSGNNRIRKVTRDGTITTIAGGGGKYYGDSGDGDKAVKARLSFPFGVAVARDGTIYIADSGNNRLRMVTPSGFIEPLAGTGTAGYGGDGASALAAELASPEGIALDGKGDLLVADTLNLRVREVVGVQP